MREQLEKRINELKVELKAIQKIVDELENGRSESQSGISRRKRQAISKRGVFGLIILAAFLLLTANLQSQQES